MKSTSHTFAGQDVLTSIHQEETFEDVPTNDWPTPQIIEGTLPAVEPYQPDMIPHAFRAWISDTANRMQVPPDYLAATLVTLCGSLIGSRCAVKPKAKDNWQIVPNLWGMIIGDPSQLKTGSAQQPLKFLAPLIEDAQRDFAERLSEHDLETASYVADRKRLEREMKNKDKAIREQAKAELAELKKTEKPSPTLRRYEVNDINSAKLAYLCAENPQGLLSFNDEIVSLIKSFEMKGNELGRGFYLKAWDGTQRHTVDRVMSGSFFIRYLCLSVFGTTQPDKVRAYLADAKGGNNDGLIQRFQIMVYPDPLHRDYVDTDPDKQAWATAQSVICKLAELEDFGSLGAEQQAEKEIPAFRFDSDAQPIFKNWAIELEAELQEFSNSQLMREHLAKYRSLMPSLALIFHLINVAQAPKLYNGRIKPDSALMAVKWCDYLKSHARRVYDGLGAKGAEGAAILSDRILKGLLTDGFSLRNIQRKGWSGLTDGKAIAAALERLQDADWIAAMPTPPIGKAGGRPSDKAYAINPNVFQWSPLTDKTDRTHE
jgi:hypothetical protein